MNEEWREIVGCPGYLVSNFGRVKGPRGKILKLLDNGNGYKQFSFGHGHKKYVHRSVVAAFIPNPDGRKCINHKDGDKANNNVNNLEWCSYSYNNHHSYAFLGRTDPRSKKVRNVTTGEIFDSIRSASRFAGQDNNNSNLRRAIARNGTCGGYRWEYV